MTSVEQHLVTEDTLKDWVLRFSLDASTGALIWLEGEMGAGKSTLARALLSSFGVPEERFGGSPTYTLMQVYPLPGGKTALHADLYRIETEDALFEMGLEAACEEEHSIVLIEWGSRFPDWKEIASRGFKARARNVIEISLERVLGNDGVRRLSWSRL